MSNWKDELIEIMGSEHWRLNKSNELEWGTETYEGMYWFSLRELSLKDEKKVKAFIQLGGLYDKT